MSFSFSQALISETCPLTQPMGSDGQSQVTHHPPNHNMFQATYCRSVISLFKEYERESQLSQEQFSQDMCNPTSQTFSRPASQDLSRLGFSRQGSVPGWTTTDIQQESVTEVNISPKINISSRTPKMALHETPRTPCPWIVIFLHGPKKRQFFCTW